MRQFFFRTDENENKRPKHSRPGWSCVLQRQADLARHGRHIFARAALEMRLFISTLRRSTRIAGLLLIGAASCLATVVASAGTITGTVRAQGAELPADAGASSGGNYGSRRYKFLEKVDYEQMSDFIVYIDQPAPAGSAPATPPPLAVIRQRDGAFVPHVTPVAVGTTVEWPNDDEIYHNVFSMSDKTPFDLGLYKNGDAAKRVTFDQPGRVDVFCSIHTKMSCIVLVVPNRWFARADAGGRFTIRDVPAGTWKLRAGHDRLPSQVKEIVVPAEGSAEADFILGISGLPRP
jgi:plastocyanin